MSSDSVSYYIRFDFPYPEQSYLGNRIPFQAWCVTSVSDEDLLKKVSETSVRFFLHEEVSSDTEFKFICGFSGYEIPKVKGDEYSCYIEQLSVQMGSAPYISEDQKEYGIPAMITGELVLPSTASRGIFYSFFIVLEVDDTTSVSNNAGFYLYDKAQKGLGFQGGVFTKLPKDLYAPRLILSSWAIEDGEKIESVITEVRFHEGGIPEACIKTFCNLHSERSRYAFPDRPEASIAGIEAHVVIPTVSEMGRDFADTEIVQRVKTSASDNEYLLSFGTTRIHFKKPEVLIHSMHIDESVLNIHGSILLSLEHQEEFFLQFNSKKYSLEDLGGQIEFCYETKEVRFGSLSDRVRYNFAIKIPVFNIPLNISHAGLYLRWGEAYRLCSTDSDSILLYALIQRTQKKLFGVSEAITVAGEVRKSIKNFLGTSFRVPRKDPPLLPRVPGDRISLYFHNVASSEGGPAVLRTLLENFPLSLEISKSSIDVTSFYGGGMEAEIKTLCKDFYLLESGSMINQTTSRYFESVTELRKKMRKENYRFIIANCLDSFLAIEAAYRERIPAIWIIHESVYPDEWYRGYSDRLRLHFLQSFKWVSKVIFVSQKTRSLYKEYLEDDKVEVIPNGIDWYAFQKEVQKHSKKAVREEFGIDFDSIVFLSVGTITERKGQHRTIPELALFREKYPTLHFHMLMVGARELPYLHTLRKMIDEYELTSQVTLVPETPDVHRFYAAADIFIINSIEESFPLVTLEAFSAGLSVVSTKVFGLQEIIRHEENALGIDGSLEGELSETLHRLINDDNLRRKITEGGYQCVREKYNLEATLSAYKKIFRNYT
jgi:glycosyltransferase involved in cell wall biosynthesis